MHLEATISEPLYFEAHITIDPVFDDKLIQFSEASAGSGFRVAKLLMQKGEPSKLDSFCTGKGKDGEELLERTMTLVKRLSKSGFNVRRYKIEAVVLDVRSKPMEIIKFLRVKEPYGFLSNFWVCPIEYDSKTWKTSEHLYQAMKHLGTSYVLDIHEASSAWVAMKMGRDVEHPPRQNWEAIKDDVMRHVLALKFLQNVDLGDQLLATGDALLVEHGAHDKYWADGGNGSGLNKLGLCLMEIREVLKAHREAEAEFEQMNSMGVAVPMYVSPMTAYIHNLSKTTGMKP